MHPGNSIVVRLDGGETLLLAGLAQVNLSEGSAECLGASVRRNCWMRVEELRLAPILALDRSVLEITIGQGGSWRVVGESTIPTGWSEAAQVVERQHGVTVIIGDVDSGKSSLCTFLANVCARSGLRVAVVDADVGQADIGPPTTVSSAHLSEPVWSLQEMRIEEAFFAGDTSPALVPDKLIQSIVRLKENLYASTDIVLLNTDGWVADSAAFRFKCELMDEVRPDLVIGLGNDDEIEPLLRIMSPASLKIPSSAYARARSREERKKAREAGYRRFLLGSKTLKIRQEETVLRTFNQPQQSVLRWDKKFRSSLAGLLDSDERLLGVGRIRELIDGNAMVETNVTKRPRFLEVGNLLLSSDYEEIGYGILH